MKRVSLILMVLLTLCLFLSCSSMRYRKLDTTQIELPDHLEEAFNGTTTEQIEWYLASSKDWSFTKTGEKTMARAYVPGESYEPYVRITVFTQGYFETGAKYEPNQMIEANSEPFDLNVYEHPWPDEGLLGSDRYFSSVTIKFSETFFVRFDEYSYDPERKMTLSAIRDIFKLFADRTEQENELRGDGSIKREGAFLKVEENKYGTCDISGFVHLSQKSACRIKIVDPVTSETYFDQQADDNSLFYVGWSEDESDGFYFYQRLTIKKKADGPESADVIIQLWAEDADGARCVLEKNENLTFWVR